jgi:hypothetical protein
MRCRIGTLAPLLLWPLGAQAGNINDQLMKLDPEERAHQVCVIKGIDTIRREGKLPKADRLKTSITGRAAFTGTQVATKGGAVRAQSHWYGLQFKCDVTADQMKALTFTYVIGKEIPENKWEDLGLWR